MAGWDQVYQSYNRLEIRMLKKHFIFPALIIRLINLVQNRVGCGLGYDETRKLRFLLKKSKLLDPSIPRRD